MSRSLRAEENAGDGAGRATCQLCGALIVGDATQCRMCGNVFKPAPRQLDLPGPAAAMLDRYYFHAVMALAGLAALGLAFYVIPTPLYAGPWVRLLTVLGILFISTAMVTMLDARIASRAEDDISAQNPVRWFGFTLAAWFAALPMYLQQRTAASHEQRYARTRAAVGASGVVALLAVVSIGMIFWRQHQCRGDQETMRAIIENRQAMKKTLDGTRP